MNAHEIVQAHLLCRGTPICFPARRGRLLLSPDHDGTGFRSIAWRGKPFRSLPIPRQFEPLTLRLLKNRAVIAERVQVIANPSHSEDRPHRSRDYGADQGARRQARDAAGWECRTSAESIEPFHPGNSAGGERAESAPSPVSRLI
jgi:hypothetical protein